MPDHNRQPHHIGLVFLHRRGSEGLCLEGVVQPIRECNGEQRDGADGQCVCVLRDIDQYGIGDDGHVVGGQHRGGCEYDLGCGEGH